MRLAKHPDFEVDGHNLIYELELAPWEAALGAEISVPTLDGQVNIKIPAGTAQRPETPRARTRPAAQAGDLIVVTRIVVPAQDFRRGEEIVGTARARIQVQSERLT